MTSQPAAALVVVAALCATAACSAIPDSDPASAAGRSESRGATAASSAEATPSGPSGGPRARERREGTASGSPSPRVAGEGGEDSGGPEPGRRDPDGGEGAAPVSGPPGLPGLRPPDRRPLITLPLPPFTSRQGVVAGYPRKGLPAVPGSRGLLTSVSPEGRRLQVALDGLTPRAPGKVLLFYRVHLSGLGFAERTTTATPGSEAAGFVRGGNVVTVTATRRDGATSYTVFATLRAGEG